MNHNSACLGCFAVVCLRSQAEAWKALLPWAHPNALEFLGEVFLVKFPLQPKASSVLCLYAGGHLDPAGLRLLSAGLTLSALVQPPGQDHAEQVQVAIFGLEAGLSWSSGRLATDSLEIKVVQQKLDPPTSQSQIGRYYQPDSIVNVSSAEALADALPLLRIGALQIVVDRSLAQSDSPNRFSAENASERSSKQLTASIKMKVDLPFVSVDLRLEILQRLARLARAHTEQSTKYQAVAAAAAAAAVGENTQVCSAFNSNVQAGAAAEASALKDDGGQELGSNIGSIPLTISFEVSSLTAQLHHGAGLGSGCSTDNQGASAAGLACWANKLHFSMSRSQAQV